MKVKRFSILELLVVFIMIAFALGIVYIVVNPPEKLTKARSVDKWSSIIEISNAILEYQIDNEEALPLGIDNIVTSSQVLGTNQNGCSFGCPNADGGETADSCLDLSDVLVDKYLLSMPYDPFIGTEGFSGFYINKSHNGRLMIGACESEDGATIELQR